MAGHDPGASVQFADLVHAVNLVPTDPLSVSAKYPDGTRSEFGQGEPGVALDFHRETSSGSAGGLYQMGDVQARSCMLTGKPSGSAIPVRAAS